MLVRTLGQDSARRGSFEESLLNQIWFDDILNGAAFLADSGGQAIDAHRPTGKIFHYRA